MTLDVQTIATLCPDVAPDRVATHLDRLDDEYVQCFAPAVVAAHLQSLAQLSAQQPVQVLLEQTADRSATCTVLGFDHPFEFSLITGVLAGTGFLIESGDVFTLRCPQSAPARRRGVTASQRRGGATAGERRAAIPRSRAQQNKHDPFGQRVFIDHFHGRLGPQADADNWAEQLRTAMHEVIGLLDRGDDESIEKAKRQANEMVTHRLAALEPDTRPILAPIDLHVDQPDDKCTRLTIKGPDTPAFLYALSNALSLHGLSIERVRIGSASDGDGVNVEDEIYVVGADGQPITDEPLIERVKLSVLLTKQFTYFLERAPDPYTALQRFEQLTLDIARQPQQEQWLTLLSDPAAMQDLAKLLGTSDYLWEDFIRVQHESLLPVLGPHRGDQPFSEPPETVPLRLEQCLKGAATLDEQRDRLNQFKDEEIFRIDLDHILSPSVDFREFSRRLTLLAENLIAAAAEAVYRDLVDQFGTPKTEQNKVAYYAIFGLGKLGGIALGYASDIELLFVYSSVGKTSGGQRDPITNPEFFEQLAQQTSAFIRTKQEGIFQVDLRLRPYGREGPLASSLPQLRSYFEPGGPAHPFEKLALVRMRWVAGDAGLGYEVEQLRDQCIYHEPHLDQDALWDAWAKQHQQKLRDPPPGKGRVNAKYSPGALADLEGAVQWLQVTLAHRVPQLQSPRLSVVMEGLRRAKVLTPRQYSDLVGAYGFFRRLINALRILRGSAIDLWLPAEDSDEFVHLARRMGYTKQDDREPGEQLAQEFESRSASVRNFIGQTFDRPCPGTEVCKSNEEKATKRLSDEATAG